MERRTNLRFELQLMCRLRRNGALEIIDALTINVSRCGALVSVNSGQPCHLREGDDVNVEFPLPPHERFGPRCLSCEGKAVRLMERADACVVALRFDRMEIRDAAPLVFSMQTTAVM